MNTLITGGTGSLGKAIIREIVSSGPAEFREFRERQIHVYSRDEHKQYELKKLYPLVTFIVGDIRDKARLIQVVAQYNIQEIIHCAALKHVSACEENPAEAIATNVTGSMNVIEAAVTGNAYLVAISTDKAVDPTNVYGNTKRLMELLCINESRISAHVIRFGNFFSSRGSVIPYFKKLIKKEKPLQVTNMDMTRFWISLRAGAKEVIIYRKLEMNILNSKIIVPRMKAATIREIINGFSSSTYYTIVGKRSGEKLHEILISEEEVTRTQMSINRFVICKKEGLKHSPTNYKGPIPYSSETAPKWSVKALHRRLR
jgi:UDP-N-acetylglucosamine 4,6-dehydratase